MITNYEVWVDGSCSNNGKPDAKMGIGCVTISQFGITEFSKPISMKEIPNDFIIESDMRLTPKWNKGTNNIAELMAIYYGLKNIPVNLHSYKTTVKLYTDSQWAKGVLVDGWKANYYVKLIEKIQEEITRFESVTIEWVRGHDGNEYNERSHDLASAARKL